MSAADPVRSLQEALLHRAQTLADEYLQHGREVRERIAEESAAVLRRREEQETRLAKSLGERLYRQRLQAGKLALRAELEHLRWTWMHAIFEKLQARLVHLVADESAYLPILAKLFMQAAEAIERDQLVAQLNATDLQRLRGRWESWSAELVPSKKVLLSSDPIDCMGGILLLSHDKRIRVNNTFEGRLERLQDELQRLIQEHFFGSALAGVELEAADQSRVPESLSPSS
jgi:V/A-type H+/Na+-transporting ATPase subunit E